MRLRKIKIQDFKNFKNIEIRFKKFNVVVGDVLGKTLLVNLFSSLKKGEIQARLFFEDKRKSSDVEDFLERMIILKDLEDKNNCVNILYDLYSKKEEIPNKVRDVVSYLFPGLHLRFNDDGRAWFEVEGLDWEDIPKSLCKALVIFMALESNPSLLVIDEIESSFPPGVLETLVEELKDSNSAVILTTNSTVVIDMVDPDDLIIVERKKRNLVFRRIEDPGGLRERLSESGITLSDKWLYGKL